MAELVDFSPAVGEGGRGAAALVRNAPSAAPVIMGHENIGTIAKAGPSLIIVTGTSKDAARMEVSKKLGADHVIDVQKEDPLVRIMEITAGKGVDVVLDCTAGAGTLPGLLGVEGKRDSYPTFRWRSGDGLMPSHER
jgi:threonine dehydrogenase-like Zn-dependent dehydrogenase